MSLFEEEVINFKPRDYLYMQQTIATMLNVIARHYFVCVKGTKPFEVLLLEGQDG
jgi:hypothetical protein